MELMQTDEDKKYSLQTLEEWVMGKCDEYRNHYEDNYQDLHQSYYRLWRGKWAKEDSMRDSERSRLIAPALQQAVESSVAEVEEASFGRGKWFDLHDDFQDPEKEDVQFIKTQLYEDMQCAKARSAISEVLINSAVFGTGVGELYLEEVEYRKPATQPSANNTELVGVNVESKMLVKLRPIMPQNFLIDPLATSIDEALGVAIDMDVPYHQVIQDIERGIYADVHVAPVPSTYELEADQDLTYNEGDRVRLTKWYGLVPTDLFNAAQAFLEGINAEDEEAAEEALAKALNQAEKDEDAPEYVEAIVVIANSDTLLKVESSPYMMKDRPVIAFQWDIVPSSFWGRGVCEKGFHSQKALDTELRARIDALALTIHPMLAVDATRMPRGAKPTIKAGKTILTNGNPAEILQPFNFGAVDQITFAQGAALQGMVQQATGAVDTVGMQNAMQGDAAVGAISMSLGAIIKRHKRTLLNFQENFLMPFVTKAAYYYMQFDPDRYKAQDFKFVPAGTLGIIAREYEVTQLVQLLQTMPPESPIYAALIESIVESMNLTNREGIIARIKQANEPDPAQQQMQQQQQQIAMQAQMLQVQDLAMNVAEKQTRVQQNQVETQILPFDAETKRIAAMAKTLPPSEFEQFVKAVELELAKETNDIKAADVISNEQIAALQMLTNVNQRGNNQQ